MNIRLMIQKTKPDSAGFCPIYVEVSVNPKDGKKDTKRIPTGEKIPVRYWSKKQEVMSSYAGHGDVNRAILKKKLEVQHLIRENPDATPAEIKQLAEKKPLAKTPDILNLYESFFQFKKSRISPNGMKAIHALQSLLTDYIGDGHRLSLKDLSQNTYDALYLYSLSKYNHPNTTTRRFVTLITFLNHLTDRNINTNTDYRKWKLPKLIPTKMTTLTYDELTQVFNLKLSNAKLDKVRDLFIILCTTGLRFSDGKKLKPHDVNGDTILVRADKTNAILTIPLNDFSRTILKKHNNDLSGLAMSNQKFNEYIKDVCKAAGLTTPVLVNDRTKKNTTVTKEKHEVISSHTGRRTFVTLSLELGMRQDVIMALTGHQDQRSFKKYIDHTDFVKASEMTKWNKQVAQ